MRCEGVRTKITKHTTHLLADFIVCLAILKGALTPLFILAQQC
jgi:hypothetical protein